LLELLDDLRLALGQHFGQHFVDSERTRHGFGGGPAVAGEHHQPQALLPQAPNRLGSGGLERIRHRERGGRATIDDEEHHRLSLRAHRRSLCLERRHVHWKLGQEAGVAEEHPPAFDHAPHALPGIA
jgi:hypothetical protein